MADGLEEGSTQKVKIEEQGTVILEQSKTSVK